ncbi:Calcineurin-like phosphoesterase [Anaerohalosphaera lusitana]|uniref:Calcineurin-like phosphoesterase n=1 Tax=Anaerohalosphaera lusitana TaxID=1936003 RepID=A0A1U9NJP9_9BACT|nr:metallophosphoesterase [Anaerohalosphaera lusitana]AQT67968.1 Calcineurin-like phosphoesterase [Anaerohalosphaera lusitana]
MAQRVIDLCKRGAEQNNKAKYRQGNVILLPEAAEVVVTGDLHGHRRNFERITQYADLETNHNRHIIFQEILHGGPEDECGGCLSFRVFADIIEYQLRYPDRVHLIMGNHDTAIINDRDVLKNGKEMNRALTGAMQRCFGDQYEEVSTALDEYLFSQPLAVKSPNGVWISHSLPKDRFVDDFDPSIFERPLTSEDLHRPNSVYLLTWGRRHSESTLQTLAEMLGVDIFILGHQAQDSGWCKAGKNLIILASDHDRGCMLKFETDKTYTANELAEAIIPLASLD